MTQISVSSATTGSSANRADCLELAREAVNCARAFRRSVAEFDNIHVDVIFSELKIMRSSLQA